METVELFEKGLLFHCQLAQTKLQSYINFHSEVEKYWENINNKLTKDMESLFFKYSQKYHRDLSEDYAHDFRTNEDYLDIHRKSLIISIYSFFEHQVNDLCRIFSEIIDTQIQLNDLSGQGFERAKIYLRKVVCLDLSGSISKELGYIGNINRIRNTIVHNGSMLPKDANHKINRFVLENPNLHGKPDTVFSIHPRFIDELIENLAVFFKKLDKEVVKYINNELNDI